MRRVGDSGAVPVSGGIGAADGPGRQGGSGPGADAAGPGAGLPPGFLLGWPILCPPVAGTGISRPEACRLFILGVAGLGCFGSLRAGGLLWAVHVLAALGIALVLPRRPLPPGRDAAGVRPPAFAAAFVRSVRDAAGAMVQICGFVVFFLAALRLTARLTGLSHPLLSGRWS